MYHGFTLVWQTCLRVMPVKASFLNFSGRTVFSSKVEDDTKKIPEIEGNDQLEDTLKFPPTALYDLICN